MRLSLTRGAFTLTAPAAAVRTSRRRLVAVAHYLAVPVLVEMVSELVDVGGNLVLYAASSIVRAPLRTISSSKDCPVDVGLVVVVVYKREHGRTFPQARQCWVDQIPIPCRSSSGKV
jgi:hypothetical protein